MVIPYNGQPLPTTTDRRWYKVIVPQGSVPLTVLLLDDTFMGFWTHWIENEANPKGRVIPCPGDERCHLCKAGLGNRWTGYMACYSANHKEDKVAALTEGAARQLLPLLAKRGSLRGVKIRLQRVKVGTEKFVRPNGPIQVTVLDYLSVDRVPLPFPVLPSLHRMWGIKDGYNFRAYGNPLEGRRIDRDPNSTEALDRSQENDQGERKEGGAGNELDA